MMTLTGYYIVCGLLSLLALVGISMMSKVTTAKSGNLLLSFCLLAGLIVTLLHYRIVEVPTIYALVLVGSIIGAYIARKVQMMQMPQTVAMLNGLGGLAGGIVGALTFIHVGVEESAYPLFVNVTAIIAVVVGMVTFVGSMVAAGKLHRLLSQKPIIWKGHEGIIWLTIIGSLLAIALGFVVEMDLGLFSNPYFILLIGAVSGSFFGLAFAVRVGGADMPITISLLTSLAGIAAAIAGLAIGDLLVVSIGGIVGSSGLVLTQIMCRAMNRKLMVILTGKTSTSAKAPTAQKEVKAAVAKPEAKKEATLSDILQSTKRAIIVPGYGMALAQAQHQVRQLADMLESKGADVKYAIHPVAGRMPGHMNVLLAEADVPYDKLFEMDAINDDFKDTDLVVVIGANDVLNPAARDAEDTPIYGMPVLNVDQAKHVVICNFDLKPGYAGVPNPLYEMKDKVTLMLGDAKESLNKLMQELNSSKSRTSEKAEAKGSTVGGILKSTKRAIIVPGYGMALAQAQHQVRQLADMLESKGADVKYAIHPVAGRMPGHMNVLLAEADVPYDKLYEMDAINDDFKDTDLVVVIGANDVLNPAARDAEDTPIYGMPVLNVDQAKHVVICNFDLKPGYAGVPNPLYEMKDKVTLMLGDAKESLSKLMQELNSSDSEEVVEDKGSDIADVLQTAKRAIIVPGYGMALAQAQHQVRQLADMLESKGADVKYAIHPVAGRMPGHMNVLLAEADVPYDKLYEMDAINDDFKDTDLVVVIGANDVLNPAARDAEDTPIYGMPVLNVDQAKHVVICNFDLKPGYAGVPNPLYEMEDKVTLMLGDAKESLSKLMQALNSDRSAKKKTEPKGPSIGGILKGAKRAIIVPGYGMALAQAQHQVRQLADMLESKGADVKYAIHPVAGRMPGHMNVLLAEADVSYDKLYEMDAINDDFKDTDLVVVIGANDVLNPAARDAEDTPIYGMPVLNVDQAKHIIICNFDLKPGYAGVPNPLYEMEDKVTLMLGDAKESLSQLMQALNSSDEAPAQEEPKGVDVAEVLNSAKRAIIVPGYGMALAQAQHQVRQLADRLESKGADVKYAIHPVAGRMPGHMNVLLAEADVSYDKLYEMDAINDDFKDTDLVVVIGANDVLNPAARDAEDTPIYGMPVLNVDQAKHIIICNFDLKPGYAGVPNPLYEMEDKVTLMLGDAKESLNQLMSKLN